MKSLNTLHTEMLAASGLTEAVIKDRGYWTANRKAELAALGFPESQRLVPCLVVPLWTVDGQCGGHQIRPDTPRQRDGKQVKYETAAKQPPMLDVPPASRGALRDPRTPLWITEGSKKADCAAGRGVCCVSLQGVWNWRGAVGANGGKVELPDWDRVALNDRKVYLAFDSDVTEKPAVAKALHRLAAVLERRRAEVLVIRIPTPDGRKMGLDDFLASGCTVEALLAGATRELPEVPGGTGDDEYAIRDGRVCWLKKIAGDRVAVPLCNFEGRIVGYESHDDGAEVDGRYIVEGSRNGVPFERATVPVGSFDGFGWLGTQWRGKAIAAAGFGLREHLAVALKSMGLDEREDRTVYGHIGWREVNGRWVYLHAGGAIGADGPVDGLSVDPGRAAGLYKLPDPPTGAELSGAIHKAMRLLDVGPDRVTVPLLAGVFRSCLGPADLSLYLMGRTGTWKTTLAMQAIRFFAPGFTRGALMGWNSTANALRAAFFEAKDSMVLVDDFKPGNPKMDAAATALLQNQGDLTGRDRADVNGNLRAGKPPRCLPLVTGEDLPPGGESTVARCFVLELRKGECSGAIGREVEKLGADGVLASVTSAYIRWLAESESRRSVGAEELADVRAAVGRELSTGGELHDRVAEQAAHLLIGLSRFGWFALSSGCWHAEEAADFQARCRKAIMESALSQGEFNEGADPARRFVTLVMAAIRSGAAYVLDRDGNRPGGEYAWPNDKPTGRQVGWVCNEEDALWLDPEAARSAACEMARMQNVPFGWSANVVSRRLKEGGFLRLNGEKNIASKRLVSRGGDKFHARVYVLDKSPVPESRVCRVEPENAGEPATAEPENRTLLSESGPEKVGSGSGEPEEAVEPGEPEAQTEPYKPYFSADDIPRYIL